MPEADLQTGAEAGRAVSTLPPVEPLASSPTPVSVQPPAAGENRQTYLPQLDGLRAVAIVMVFVHHALTVPLLWSGVDLFFILSGYLITNILLRDSSRMSFGAMLGHFYLRRAQRILPAYLLCLALVGALTVQDWGALWPYYAFFLQNVPYAFHKLAFSPLIPLWSLAVEQHFYLFWPFLVYFLPRRTLAPCMLALLVGVPVLRAACTPLFPYPEPIYVLTPFRIDTMAAGALFALWLPTYRRHQALLWAQLAIPFGLIAYALLSMHPWFRRNANSPEFNGLAYSLNIVIMGGLFVWALLADTQSRLYRLLASSPLRSLGRISYAFYLFHLLVLERFGGYFPRSVGAIALFLITVALAALSWALVEKPLLSLGSRKPTFSPPPPRPPALA